MTAHSRFGGSSADRWLNCAGSTALIATIPPKGSSVYAAEGTLAHKVGEYCLRQGYRDANSFISASLPLSEDDSGKVIGQDMVTAVNVYLDAVFAELDASDDAELFVEQGFVLDIDTAEAGEVFGTNDAMVYTPSKKRLVVFDYKHGAGVSVTADDNVQLKFYAAGAILANPDWRVSDLTLTIVQPRARDVDDLGAVRPWPMDFLEVLTFVDEASIAIGEAKDIIAGYAATGQLIGMRDDLGTAPRLKEGKWCRWCDAAAAAVCPAKEAAILREAQLDFVDMTQITADDLPEPKTLDTDRLGQILKAGTLLNAWLNQVQEYVEARLMTGDKIEGWKVVEKIGRAKWTEEGDKVADELNMMFDIDEELVRPRKLTTITEVEKLLKANGATKEQIDDIKMRYTVKDSSGLTIAPASDRRPAVDALASDFGDINI